MLCQKQTDNLYTKKWLSHDLCLENVVVRATIEIFILLEKLISLSQ